MEHLTVSIAEVYLGEIRMEMVMHGEPVQVKSDTATFLIYPSRCTRTIVISMPDE